MSTDTKGNEVAPRTIGWDEIPDPTDVRKNSQNKNTGPKNSDLFLKLPQGVHRIRLVGKPLPLDLAFFPNPQNSGGKDKTKSETLKYLIPKEYIDRVKSLGVEVKDYYAICVFDRADTEAGITRIKILEKGLSVIKPFRNYAKYRKDTEGKSINPGGAQGPNWLIEVTSTGPNRYNISYDIQPLDSAPWSETEKEFLRRDPHDKQYENLPLGERGKVILEEYYDLAKAKERLEKFLTGNSGVSSASAENVSDYKEGAPKITIGSLDDLPSVDEDTEATVARQLRDEVF